MKIIQDRNDFNLWDLHVTAIRLFQSSDADGPKYDLVVEVDIRSGTLG
jgi:hypothetical protein